MSMELKQQTNYMYLGGVMTMMLAPSAVNVGFKSVSGQANDYTFYIFSASPLNTQH